MIGLRAFGPLTVMTVDDARTVPQRRERALLAILVVAASEPVPTGRLIDQLWSGEPPPRAHTSLQVAISRLRTTLEPGRVRRAPAGHLVHVGNGYALRIAASAVDVWRFAADARRVAADHGQPAQSADGGDRLARCDAALAAWTGTPYADCADTAVVRAEVDRLIEARLALVEMRAEVLLGLGRADEVARELAPLARENPFREGLWSLLALAQYQSLRQADALATLRTLRERLADDLGLDPSTRVGDLERDILQQSRELAAPERIAATRPATGDEHGLVGRHAALATLTTAVDRLMSGDRGTVIVSGEAGIGKSRLVAAAGQYAGANGAAVLAGRCHEADVAPAYWPWLPIVRQLAGVDVPSEIRPFLDTRTQAAVDSGGAAALRTYDAVARLIAAAGRRQPLLVVIEDIHWADPSSLRMLAYVAEIVDAPVLFAVTRRTAEHASDALIAALVSLARSGAERIHVDGLAVDDVSALLRRHLGTHDHTLARVVADRTEGNPLFVIEFGRLLRATGISEPDEARHIAVPDGIADVLRMRLRALPDDAARLLSVAAVAGRDINPALVATVAQVPTGTVLDALDAAEAAALVTSTLPATSAPWSLPPTSAHNRISFAHALVRETLYADLPAGRRARLHAAVADLLETRLGADPEIRTELAHHYHMAAPLDPTYASKAVHHLAAAAQIADARNAVEESTELWRRAVAASGLVRDPDPAERVRLLTAQAHAELRVGQNVAARQHIGEAMTIGRSIQRWDLAGEAASTLAGAAVWSSREWNVSDDMIGALEECVEHLPAGPLAAQVLATLQMENYYARRLDEADDCGLRSVAMARAAGDPDVLVQVLLLRTLGTWGPGTHPARRAISAELLSLPLDGERKVSTLFQYGAALHEAGQPDEAVATIRRCQDAATGMRHSIADVPLAWWWFMRAVETDAPDRVALGAKALDLHRRTRIVTIDELSGIHAIRTAGAGAAVPPDIVASAAASRNPGFRALVAYAMVEASDIAGAVGLLGAAAPGEAPDYASLAADCLRTAVFAAAGLIDEVRGALDRIATWAGEVVIYGSVDHLGAVDFFIAAGLAALGDRTNALTHARAALACCERVGNRPWGRRVAAQVARLSDATEPLSGHPDPR